jgi:tetratricopeptide (TPR) repeat protein
MERHLTQWALAGFFKGSASSPAESAVPHLISCRRCWRLAATVLGRVRQEGRLAPCPAGAAVARLIEEEERDGVEILCARSWSAKLKDAPQGEQRKKIQETVSLHTLRFFEALLDDAMELSLSDPHAAEQAALLARDLAGILPPRRYPETLKNDLCAEALTLVANCRRLAADWVGSKRAIVEARELLRRGTGDPRREAQLLSMHAALSMDTGHLEAALNLLARSIALYRAEEDVEGLSWTQIQEGNILMAAGRADEALGTAERVLSLPFLSRRFEMLAKSIAIESLVLLDRAQEALLRFLEARSLYKELPDGGGRVIRLEARILDALGRHREAERRFRKAAQKELDAECYKEAFLSFLTLFETFYQRGDLEKAADLCEEVLALVETVPCRDQLWAAWQELLSLVRQRTLEPLQVSALRQYLTRYWNNPAPHGPFELAAAAQPHFEAVEVRLPLPEPEPAAQPLPPAPEIVGHLTGAAYHEALETYERDLFKSMLSACGYSVRRTARELGVSRNTVKAWMKRFGLDQPAG